MSVARLARRKNKVAPSSPLSAPKPPPSTRSNGPSTGDRRVRPPIARASSFTRRKLGMNRSANARTAAAADPHPKELISPVHSCVWNSFSMAIATIHANREMTSCTKPRTNPIAAEPISRRKTKTSSAGTSAPLAKSARLCESGSGLEVDGQVSRGGPGGDGKVCARPGNEEPPPGEHIRDLEASGGPRRADGEAIAGAEIELSPWRNFDDIVGRGRNPPPVGKRGVERQSSDEARGVPVRVDAEGVGGNADRAFANLARCARVGLHPRGQDHAAGNERELIGEIARKRKFHAAAARGADADEAVGLVEAEIGSAEVEHPRDRLQFAGELDPDSGVDLAG